MRERERERERKRERERGEAYMIVKGNPVGIEPVKAVLLSKTLCLQIEPQQITNH
jgi:hypothetical protein